MEKQEQAKPVRGQNLLEWYEAVSYTHLPFPFLRNKEIYLGVLLKEKHPAGQSLGIIPISSQMERMHRCV